MRKFFNNFKNLSRNNACKYKSQYYPYGLNCNLNALPGDDYCIIHSDYPKDPYELLKQVEKKLDENDFDFEGSKLYDFIHHDLKTEKPVIFRDATVKGDVKLSSKDPEIEDDAEFGPLNFRGANIGGNVEFIRTIINGRVNFGNDTKIGGNIIFYSSFVKGDVDLTDIEIDGGVFFPYMIIEGGVDFSKAKINNELIFTNSEVEKNVIFNYVKINDNLFFNWDLSVDTKKLDLKGNKLEVKGNADFNNVIIGGIANFSGMNVGESFNLISSNIYGSACFEESKVGTLNHQTIVNKDANFSNTEISGDSDFKSASFGGDTIFLRTKFRGNAYFDNTIFKEKADFGESRFYENANFINTIFRKEINFAKASILSTGIFEGLENNLNLKGSFEECRLKNVSFRGCDLSQTLFKYVIFDNCELSSAIWPEDYKIYEYNQYENNKSKKVPVDSFLTNSLGILWSPELVTEAEMVADIYQRIRQSLQNQGAYILAGNFYVREMDLKREVYSQKNPGMWLIYTVLSFMTGYGEKFKKIFFIFVIYISIYIIAVYYLVPKNNLVIPIGSGGLSILTALLVYVFARKISR